MYLRNNSEKSWLQYDCGGEKVDILPLSDFQVSERSAKVILNNLGCDAWITRVEGSVVGNEIVEKEAEKKEELKEESKVLKEVKKEKAPKKGKRDKK